MNTVTMSFTITVRQMTEVYQWPICLTKKWSKCLSSVSVTNLSQQKMTRMPQQKKQVVIIKFFTILV